jgi:hypothetical protein
MSSTSRDRLATLRVLKPYCMITVQACKYTQLAMLSLLRNYCRAVAGYSTK